MPSKLILTIIAILVFGFVLRIYRITSLPMYGDELTLVYDSYSILKTGMDATGKKYPLTFQMGAGRPGGYIYGSLPFVLIFGPTELGVRALSLFSGLGLIILMYLLGTKMFNERVGLFAALMTAISPWDIYLSRGGFEAHFALFLVLLGLTAFFYHKFLLWGIGWGFALLTYPTFKLTLPLLTALVFWFSSIRKIFRNMALFVGVAILVLFAILAARETLTGGSEERFLNINLFAREDLREQIIQRINDERSYSSLPDNIKPVFHNKAFEYSRLIFENYMDSISPRFMYLRGDGNPRHNPGEWGMLYLVELPLFYLAISALWKNQKKKLTFLLGWILIVPLATMFIDPGTSTGHGLRNAAMLPPLILLSAIAISKLPIKVAILVFAIMLIQLIFILQRIYFFAPNKFARFWSSEAKASSLNALAKKGSAEKYFLSTRIDNIEYAYPVYAKIDPKLVISQYGKYPKTYGNVVITDK